MPTAWRGRAASWRDSHDQALHRPVGHRRPSHDEPALDQSPAQGHAPPPRPRLLAGVERAPEPAHRRPHRLALHVFSDGITTAEISLDQAMGEAIVVDLSFAGTNHK